MLCFGCSSYCKHQGQKFCANWSVQRGIARHSQAFLCASTTLYTSQKQQWLTASWSTHIKHTWISVELRHFQPEVHNVMSDHDDLEHEQKTVTSGASQGEIARISATHNRLHFSIFNTRDIRCKANRFLFWCHVWPHLPSTTNKKIKCAKWWSNRLCCRRHCRFNHKNCEISSSRRLCEC